jgi:hypothetical protein
MADSFFRPQCARILQPASLRDISVPLGLSDGELLKVMRDG